MTRPWKGATTYEYLEIVVKIEAQKSNIENTSTIYYTPIVDTQGYRNGNEN